jgi:hypothetical protein
VHSVSGPRASRSSLRELLPAHLELSVSRLLLLLERDCRVVVEQEGDFLERVATLIFFNVMIYFYFVECVFSPIKLPLLGEY